jgi:hypothetical protein
MKKLVGNINYLAEERLKVVFLPDQVAHYNELISAGDVFIQALDEGIEENYEGHKSAQSPGLKSFNMFCSVITTLFGIFGSAISLGGLFVMLVKHLIIPTCIMGGFSVVLIIMLYVGICMTQIFGLWRKE